MRSLFVKILGLCFLVMLTSFLANQYLWLFTMGIDRPHQDTFATLLTVEMDEARHAWELGGKPALAETLARSQKILGVSETHLTDANGVDLVTGQDRSDLVKKAVNRSRFAYSGGDQESFARISPDHRYWYFQHGGRSPIILLGWKDRLLGMAFASMPCYALCWWLAVPLRRLRDAMYRFGDGDLSARADSRRRDDFGDLARAFNKMADRIQSLMGTEKRLLRDVSHELRSPLTRLQVAIEIARSRGSDCLLDQIQQEAERLDDLIGQLLELTRAEGNFVQSAAKLVRLDLLVGRIVDSCEIEAAVRGCRLELNATTAMTVPGTGELLHRTIENVVRNAIRFAPRGSTVEISVDAIDDDARIEIRDYGPGVCEPSLGRLFDPFYRESSGNDDSRGLGLGLAIARRAVELHRGSIQAANAHPGLRVTVTLPRVLDSAAKPVLIAAG